MNALDPMLTDAQQQMLSLGLDWLHETRQPDGALVHPMGVQSPVADGRRFGFIVSSYRSATAVMIAVAAPDYVMVGGNNELTNPLKPGELAALATHLEQIGYKVSGTWNGYLEHGSVALAMEAHHTLKKAALQYCLGCPEHRTVFCYKDGCDWLDNGTAKLRPPGW